MMTRTLTFAGSTGAQLEAVLDVPDGDARGSVLLAHCFTCSKDLHTMTRLASGLADDGYAVLRFDFTGLGESGGDFAATTVTNDVRDVVLATTALIRKGFGPCGLLGHSLGGAAALLAAERLHTVRSVVTLGAPSSPSHTRHLFEDATAADTDGDRVRATIGGREFEVARSFLDDLDDHDQKGAVADLERPLLVLHAVDDEVVSIEEGERVFAAARQPKAFVPLLEGDHLLTQRSAAEDALTWVRAWFTATL